jgi:dienelactone hydrolase
VDGGKRRVGLIGAATGLLLLAALAVGLVFAFRSDGSSEDARVRIEPAEALIDAPLRLVVDGARAGEPVRLEVSATSTDGVRWTGSRIVDADDSGSVSVDGGRLLTSLHPAGVADSARLGLFPRDGALELRLEARQGDRALGTAEATRRMAGPGVSARDLTVARDGLAARYWTGPARDRRRVAVLTVGGSEGGYGNPWQAALLASHGYPVLQLAYFRAPGLPRNLRSIPLEYVERGLEWLHARPGVTDVAMVGASRGAELALLVGSTYPALVQGVAAYVPYYAVGPDSWTRAGGPIPSPSNPDPRIPAERIRGPVLLIGGGRDQVWNSAYSTTAVRTRRLEHGEKDTEALVFDDAGHVLDIAIPYLPEPTEFPSNGFTLVSGGTRQADALARTASWPRLLALLERVGR